MVYPNSLAHQGEERNIVRPVFRPPAPEDGAAVWSLIAACPPLDQNSRYCNLLQCTDFSDTCVIAEKDGSLAGWISAYRPPGDRKTLFVWQVAVHESARGEGLALQMIDSLLSRDTVHGVTCMKTTITADNKASWALFRRLAVRLSAPLVSEVGFDRDRHFGGEAETEHLVTIGAFAPR